jgi:hypothetical protein
MPPVTEETLKRQQITLIAWLLYSASSVKVNEEHTAMSAAQDLYNKGMRVDVGVATAYL